MRGAFRISSVKGISIYIHWTFLLLAGWIVLVTPGWGMGIAGTAGILLFIALVFFCVLLHEMAHALVAAHYGIRARNIVLLPIGGIASIEKFPDNPKQELFISIAGPLVNLVISALIWLLFLQNATMPVLQQPSLLVNTETFVYGLFAANLGLALFNLVPAFPMDGGRILRALLGLKLNYIRATTIAAATGRIIAVIFIITGIITFSLVLPLVGIFIIFSANAEEYYLRLKALVKDVRVGEALMYDYDSLTTSMPVKDAANVLMTNHSRYFVLMDGPVPVGSINRLEIIKAMAEMKYDVTLKELVSSELKYLDGNARVDTVLEKLAANEERIFPVMENNHFTGVISLHHVIEYLLLHKAGTVDYDRVKSLVNLLH